MKSPSSCAILLPSTLASSSTLPPSFDPFLFQVFLKPNSSVDSRHHGYFDQRQSYILSSFIIITVKALLPAPTTLDLPAATTEAKKRRVRAKILLQKFLENMNPLKNHFFFLMYLDFRINLPLSI